MNCLNCSFPLDHPKSTDVEGSVGLPLDGDILLCGSCGTALICVAGTSTRPMTKEEYNSMSVEEKNDLYFAVRACAAAAKKAKKVDENKIIVPKWLKR